jgi:serine/threonine-protein kinase
VVAVKVLSPIFATDPAYVARFKNEVAQVRKLAHPNIVPIEYFGVEGPYTYFVMPLFKASLRDALLRQKRLSPPSALNVAIQIAAALTAVHSLGLIHRDIKPDNILLSDDRALLTDFGIVRQVEFTGVGQPPTLAGSGLPIGTPQYMAPEQLSGQHADHRVDIYALGAVLYEMLTGRPPHVASTPYSMASRALTDPIRPPATLNRAVSSDLDAVVMRALARDPLDRYASATDMLAALQSVQEQPRRDMPIWREGPNLYDMGAPPPMSPYPFAPGAAAGASAASNFPPRAAMEPAPASAWSVEQRANGGTRGAGDQGGGHGNRHGRARENEDSNGPARDDDRRRGPQHWLLVALAAVLVFIALVSGLSLAVSLASRENNQSTPTSALSYESLAATSTALAQTATRVPPPPPPPPPPPLPLIVTPMTGSYPCNGSVDTTLTVFNAGPGVLTWSAAPVGPGSTGVKLDVSEGTLAVGASTPVRVTGTPTGSPFDVRFDSNGGSPTVRFICN